MTYNVFSGTLNPTHFTSLPSNATYRYEMPTTEVNVATKSHCVKVTMN